MIHPLNPATIPQNFQRIANRITYISICIIVNMDFLWKYVFSKLCILIHLTLFLSLSDCLCATIITSTFSMESSLFSRMSMISNSSSKTIHHTPSTISGCFLQVSSLHSSPILTKVHKLQVFELQQDVVDCLCKMQAKQQLHFLCFEVTNYDTSATCSPS